MNRHGSGGGWRSDPQGWIWHCEDEELFARTCAVLYADPDYDPAAWTEVRAEDMGDLWILAGEWIEWYDQDHGDETFLSQTASRARYVADRIRNEGVEHPIMAGDGPAQAETEVSLCDTDCDRVPSSASDMFYLHVLICGEGEDWPPNPRGWIWRCANEELIGRVCAVMNADSVFDGDTFSVYSLDEIDDLWVFADEWVEIYEEDPEEDGLWDERALRARQVAEKIIRRTGGDGRLAGEGTDTGVAKTGCGRARRPGKPPIRGSREKHRYEILAAWNRAKEAGVTRDKFCRENDIRMKDLENYQRWHNAREDRKM